MESLIRADSGRQLIYEVWRSFSRMIQAIVSKFDVFPALFLGLQFPGQNAFLGKGVAELIAYRL